MDMSMGDSPMPGDNLIYIYSRKSKEKSVDPDALSSDKLLIPPTFINRQPWLKGYFENVANVPLKESDVLVKHCFYDPLKKVYVTDAREILTDLIEPCGFFALNSYRTIGDSLSDALGVARADD
ncbi:hypothetical protein F8566_35800 [Actinomadura rudentiformis]|uniref:Uncharacterized protein n=1 Tax=Actinomadura rudentiformis TaxID=359158 RepID=A0A6H9YRK6_9ACTN|nr:hypothetical protein F8566_35800 [Actinomadura rudentiformis]